MDNNKIATHIDFLIHTYELDLDGYSIRLKEEMEKLHHALNHKGMHYVVNGMGNVQSLGYIIDVLCGKLGLLYRLQEYIEENSGKV